MNKKRNKYVVFCLFMLSSSAAYATSNVPELLPATNEEEENLLSLSESEQEETWLDDLTTEWHKEGIFLNAIRRIHRGPEGKKAADQERVAFALNLFRNGWYTSWPGFLHIKNPSSPHIRNKIVDTRVLGALENIGHIQHYEKTYRFSPAQASALHDLVQSWSRYPESWQLPADELAVLFRTVEEHGFASRDWKHTLPALGILAQNLTPDDLEEWGQWDKFVHQILVPLHKAEDKEKQAALMAEEHLARKAEEWDLTVSKLKSQAFNRFCEGMESLLFREPVIWGMEGQTKDPAKGAYDLISVYPDGSLWKPQPWLIAAGKRYMLRYESVYADPFASFLDQADTVWQELMDPLLAMQDQAVSAYWKGFQPWLLDRLTEQHQEETRQLVAADMQTLWHKIDAENLLSRDPHRLFLGKQAVARLVRLHQAMEGSLPEGEGLSAFCLALVQNVDQNGGTRCIDGLHEFLGEMEQKYVYKVPADAPRALRASIVIAKILRDERNDTLRKVLNDLFPLGSTGTEVRTYAFSNTFRALRHGFGLGGQDPEGTVYGFHWSLPPDEFVDRWAWGGVLRVTVGGNTRSTSLAAFTPEKAALCIQSNTGFGRPVSLDMFDDLVRLDKTLREARAQWQRRILDGEKDFANTFFKGEEAPHKAMTPAGYARILAHLGYMEAVDPPAL